MRRCAFPSALSLLFDKRNGELSVREGAARGCGQVLLRESLLPREVAGAAAAVFSVAKKRCRSIRTMADIRIEHDDEFEVHESLGSSNRSRLLSVVSVSAARPGCVVACTERSDLARIIVLTAIVITCHPERGQGARVRSMTWKRRMKAEWAPRQRHER